MRRVFAPLLIGLALSMPALAASRDFKDFWTAFATAAQQDDRKAIQAMTDWNQVGQGSSGGYDFDALYEDVFGPETRACLAKAAPEKDEQGQYVAFCGEDIFVFAENGGDWQLIDIGLND